MFAESLNLVNRLIILTILTVNIAALDQLHHPQSQHSAFIVPNLVETDRHTNNQRNTEDYLNQNDSKQSNHSDHLKHVVKSDKDETDNIFGSATADKPEDNDTTSTKIIIGCIVYSITIWTIIGNVFVIVAILTNRQLKQNGMSNLLIGNLAIGDLLLGLTVLPFSATLTTFKHWVFGEILCDLWLSIDVLCSTASIWGLLVISLDRFIATNHPMLYRKQQKKSVRIVLMYCTIAWLISIIVSLAPFIFNRGSGKGEKSGLRKIQNSTDQYECVLFQTPSFVIGSR